MHSSREASTLDLLLALGLCSRKPLRRRAPQGDVVMGRALLACRPAEDKTEQLRVHGILVSACNLSGDLNHQEHHPICGQECVLLLGVSGQQQHCTEAAEVMEARNCNWFLILAPGGGGNRLSNLWGLLGNLRTIGRSPREILSLLIWKTEGQA